MPLIQCKIIDSTLIGGIEYVQLGGEKLQMKTFFCYKCRLVKYPIEFKFNVLSILAC